MIIDGTCRIWGSKCGRRASCTIYDTDALIFRHPHLSYTHLLTFKATSSRLHVTLNGLLGVAMLGHFVLWYYAKDFKLVTDKVSHSPP